MRTILIAVLLVLPVLARADEISALESQRGLLESHRERLEGLLQEQSKRIARLKAQPAGLQRDYQLGASLRDNQTLADRLTKLRGQIRDLTRTLVGACDEALGRRKLVGAERSKLVRRRAELAGTLSTGSTRIVTGGHASPLDTPDDLEERADLLQDSEEKVRRQLRQLQTRLGNLEQRARLQRHATPADDNPFVEESPRRSGGVRTVVTSAGRTTADPASPSAVPGGKTQSPTPAGKFNSDTAIAGAEVGPSPPPGGGGPAHLSADTIVSIREVFDPALLREPVGNETAEGLRTRIAALKKAGDKLKQVAGSLATQAGELRRRAKKLRVWP